MTPLSVAMIGPDLDAQGGISTVARLLVEAAPRVGAEVRYFGTMKNGPRWRKAAGMVRRELVFAGQLARGWRPDVFHIHLSYFASFYRKLVWFEQAHATGRPVIVHLHIPDLAGFIEGSPVHRRMMRWMFSRAAAVVVLSRSMAGVIEALVGPGFPLVVLYNPVDLANFTPPDRSAHPAPTVVFMGEIGDRKGTWDLLAAVPRVLRRVPEAQFRFCGNGEVERLRDTVARRGLAAHVSVPGWVSGAARLAEYEGADVFCLPSYHEALPMSILEAMAMGLPVVSTPIAGIPESVEAGQTGALVEPGDRDALADQLALLLGDAALRRAQGAAGRRLAEARFGLDVIIRQHRSLWDDVRQPGARP